MNPAEIVIESVKALAPALPYLIVAGTEATKEIGKQAGGAAIEAGKKIWHWLQPHADKQPALLDAAKEVAERPDDADAQAALRVQIRKLLQAQPNLVPELGGLVTQIATQQNTVDVSGAGAVGIGGNASGVTISTNVREADRPVRPQNQ